jgi:hypothetical protein
VFFCPFLEPHLAGTRAFSVAKLNDKANFAGMSRRLDQSNPAGSNLGLIGITRLQDAGVFPIPDGEREGSKPPWKTGR